MSAIPKLPTVFEIKEDYYNLMELMENDTLEVDEDTGEVLQDNTELLKEMMQELNATKSEKLENIQYIKKQFEIIKNALKDEAKRLSERAKNLELNQKKLTDLQDFLLGGEKLKTDKFTFYYGSSEKLEIEDESIVPADYIVYKPSINKTELKKAVKRGDVNIDGIKVEKKLSLRVR